MLAGNAVEWNMSGAAIDRVGARVRAFKAAVARGECAMPAPTAGHAAPLPGDAAAWRARVFEEARAGAERDLHAPEESYGIDDAHLELERLHLAVHL